jgi:curved DNA-binding protein
LAWTEGFRRRGQEGVPQARAEASPRRQQGEGAEEKFKEVAEAYQTLKDPEKRAAYDQLGTGFQPGQDFRPPPDWERQFHTQGGGTGGFSFEDLDLSDLFEQLRGQQREARAKRPIPGQDYEVRVQLSLDDAYRGTQLDLDLGAKTIKARIRRARPTASACGCAGKAGKGMNGGRDGDLYLDIELRPHPLYRPTGHDLYVDLPLAPWEAALGAMVEVPTLDGAVNMKIPEGTTAGRKMRIAKKGLPKPGGGEGDLYAIVQIVNPTVLSDEEKALYKQLARPRASTRAATSPGRRRND